MTDPKTKEEWQEAVNSADWALHLDSSVQYGLVERVPVEENGKITKDWHYRDSGVNVDRCNDIITRGAKQGIYPQKAE